MEGVHRSRKARYGSKDEIDGDLLFSLLESFRYGKMYDFAAEASSEAAAAAAMTPSKGVEEDDDDDDDKSHGDMLVRGSTSSVCSGSDVQIENTETEIDSTEQNIDLFAANSPITEQSTTEMRPYSEDGEIEIEEEKKGSTETTEEPDLEKLLAKQETFDLFCPNCNSCITKRVILKKRKRGLHGSVELEPEIEEKPKDIEEMEPPVKVPTGEEEEERHEVFSCLSCLNFFTRLGTKMMPLDLLKKERELFRPRGFVKQCSKSLGTFWSRRPSVLAMDQPIGRTYEILWWGKPGSDTDHFIRDKEETVRVSIHSGTSTSDATRRPEEREENREGHLHSEIFECIVYGGLIETITSLSVVSSAAASGASTVNILALAIANLVGGMIVLIHNLRDVRNENGDLVTTFEEEEKDKHSWFHALIAVLSYVFFGLIPPLVYAFSLGLTRKYRVASVFSVSLVFIVLLSMMKAYVSQPPKSYIKSVTHYVGTAVTSSGISFLVGNLFGEFLEKHQTGMTSVLEPGLVSL